jgi:hypothetical protein
MRTRIVRPFALGLALFATVMTGAARLHAQVTTATLLGHVHDISEAVLPGAVVVAKQEATGIERQTVTNERGEFVMTALPTGPYSITIEMPGFKTYTQHGLVLMSGQNVQQTFTLEVGGQEQTITVEGSAPLVETAASSQSNSLGTQEVRELPISRRNITNLLGVVPGVTASTSGTVQMNGVAGGGTGVTVDGTDANSNPETRSLSQYGSQNQISVMSLDAIAEVQVIKGVLPAEYGGVAGGQVNLISRSGTNRYAGPARSISTAARSAVRSSRTASSSSRRTKATASGPACHSAARCPRRRRAKRSWPRCRFPRRPSRSTRCPSPPNPSSPHQASSTRASAGIADSARAAGRRITCCSRATSRCRTACARR